MARITRRVVLAGAIGAVSGCGFHPVYAPAAPGTAGGDAAAELAAIDVLLIPERIGQVLRQDLQQRFEGTGTSAAKRYDLTVVVAFGQEGVDILPDSTASRLRFTAAVAYILRRQNPARDLVVSGSAHLTDAANVIDNQYFAVDLESQAISRRLMATMADQITLQLAAYFRAHPAAA